MTTVSTTPSLKLREISLGRIKHGGYQIGYDGSVPTGARLLLGLPDVHNALDVTGRKSGDVLASDNLPQFLSLIAKQEAWWGAEGRCTLFVIRDGDVIGQSNEQTFACPVRPLVGPLRPELGQGDTGPLLTYTGTPPKYPDGRVLYMPAIDGRYYFAYAGTFETDNRKRGFNCITYVGAVFGVDVNTGAMGSYGTQLANHCGCTPCDVENKTLADARAFLVKNRGTYFMWSAGHIVLVVNGTVHEFRQKLGRYNTQPVGQWEHDDRRWWVRKAPKQF